MVLVVGLGTAIALGIHNDWTIAIHIVASTLQDWYVYGVIAWFIAAAVPRIPAGAPAILAALLVVGGVHRQVFLSNQFAQLVKASAAKGMPLMRKLQGDIAVSEQEIREAHVGVFEPILLVRASCLREHNAAVTAYERAVSALALADSMAPRRLVTAEGRRSARAALAAARSALADFEARTEQIIVNDRTAVRSADAALSPGMQSIAGPILRSASARESRTARETIARERTALDAMDGIVELVEVSRLRIGYAAGPPEQFTFDDDRVRERYDKLVDTLEETQREEQDAETSVARKTGAARKRLDELVQ